MSYYIVTDDQYSSELYHPRKLRVRIGVVTRRSLVKQRNGVCIPSGPRMRCIFLESNCEMSVYPNYFVRNYDSAKANSIRHPEFPCQKLMQTLCCTQASGCIQATFFCTEPKWPRPCKSRFIREIKVRLLLSSGSRARF